MTDDLLECPGMISLHSKLFVMELRWRIYLFSEIVLHVSVAWYSIFSVSCKQTTQETFSEILRL